MKLADVNRPFLSHANYRINVHFGLLRVTIDDFADNYLLNLSPDYQRGHVWTKEQQVAYVEYLLNGGSSHREIIFNFPNWQMEKERPADEKNRMEIVDGLQRLTAVSRFINNEFSVFGAYLLNDFEDKKLILRKYDLIFFVNNLPTRADVLKYYIQINSGGIAHSAEEIDRVKDLLDKES